MTFHEYFNNHWLALTLSLLNTLGNFALDWYQLIWAQFCDNFVSHNNISLDCLESQWTTEDFCGGVCLYTFFDVTDDAHDLSARWLVKNLKSGWRISEPAMFWYVFVGFGPDSEDERKDGMNCNRDECEKETNWQVRLFCKMFFNSQTVFHGSSRSFTSEQVSCKYRIIIGHNRSHRRVAKNCRGGKAVCCCARRALFVVFSHLNLRTIFKITLLSKVIRIFTAQIIDSICTCIDALVSRT